MNNTTNVLASGIEIIGSIRFKNDMTIDGKVEGEIQSEEGKVTIGDKANITGNIHAGEVHVFGKVHGNVRSKRCHLNTTAFVNGDISTGKLSMDEGANLKGRVEIG